MTLTLLHTAAAHRATFDRLRDRIAPGTQLDHVVREDWLIRAQGGIDDDLAREITAATMAAGGPVLCSCTTLGPLAEAAGALRIDQPMMQIAAQTGGKVLMAYCLKSTETPSLSLLQREMDRAGNDSGIEPLFLGHHWPLFEAGEADEFADAIAASVRGAATMCDDLGAVVLAQAPMAAAADRLTDLGLPVLSSPETALGAALERVRQA
ncbi:hypothetical protein [Thalassovita aquimarina]|uniref:Asp/Glu/Hydantoin racemase n=1 Tax=Thalassovita aquimarina TaxID=2785917 RepID=A0ABS5HT64_9RHOB|nr:hypothetical protein [Thalassovita aquimarina]